CTTFIHILSLHDALPIWSINFTYIFATLDALATIKSSPSTAGFLGGCSAWLRQAAPVGRSADRPSRGECDPVLEIAAAPAHPHRSEEHTSELQSPDQLLC